MSDIINSIFGSSVVYLAIIFKLERRLQGIIGFSDVEEEVAGLIGGSDVEVLRKKTQERFSLFT